MSHIQSLFYTFVWTFAPELIEKGYIYASVPPLYKVTMNKRYYYLKDGAALDAFKKDNPGKTLVIGRMKGLGEMDADEIELTMLEESNRVMKQVTMDNKSEASQLFDDLMGTLVAPRRAYIEAHSAEVEVAI